METIVYCICDSCRSAKVRGYVKISSGKNGVTVSTHFHSRPVTVDPREILRVLHEPTDLSRHPSCCDHIT